MKLTPKECRKAKGISIEKVAETLGVSPVTWAKWEENPSKIPIGKAYQFCDLVMVDPQYVIFLP